jgi:hypothetical protein
MSVTFVERVNARVVDVRIGRALLSVLAAPFYVVGFLVGLVLVAVVWCWAAVQVGAGDARGLRKPGDG